MPYAPEALLSTPAVAAILLLVGLIVVGFFAVAMRGGKPR